ncbi:MAG: DUF3616 domain-containing protein, partial [Cyanobacteria bacterium P01_C01_bin.73]
MTAVPNRQIQLQFQSAYGFVHQDLSAVRCVSDRFLWLGCDETATLERVTIEGDIAADHKHISLTDYLDLPNETDEEVDVEGIAYSDHYLWVVGSHSLKRKKAKLDASDAENIERLARLEQEDNRYLLARIPHVEGELFKICSQPDNPEITLTAAQLEFKKSGNTLIKVLKDDPHLGAFLKADIPGKDNGFDIEGIAAYPSEEDGETRIFIGLRGPVLRGWAILLELQLEADGSDLKLTKMGPDKVRYRKHFVDLRGLGIRDLCPIGNDLLILAGPTMDLSAAIRLFCLKDIDHLDNDALLNPDAVLEIPYGQGFDKAEGITLLPDGNLLVVYDSPGSDRVNQAMTAVLADVFELSS